MSKRKAVAGLAVAIAFAAACSDSQPTEPIQGADDSGSLFSRGVVSSLNENTLDAAFAEIAAAVPGFAGAYYGADGALNVVMAGPVSGMRSLSGHLEALGMDVAGREVVVHQGEYDFAQLHAFHIEARALLGIDNVVFTDADEAANRITVGVADAAAAASVQHAIGMMSAPAAAFRIVEVDPILPMQTLQSRVRPTASGLQINFPGFLCSLGFNVRSPNRPNVHGFVTNSHCTNNQWQFNPAAPTPYAQPSGVGQGPAGPNFIGWEAHDAPGFTGPPCPAGRICRNSDAAGVQYTIDPAEIAFGRMYKTTARNSLTIDPVDPLWTIVAEAPGNQAVGTEIHKSGRTTGWTWGSVTSSCANTNVGGTNFTVFCQDIVTGPSGSVGGGDSGSGTFRRLDPAGLDVELTGILWGGSGSTVFVYSPMSQVRADNPPPPGVAQWIVFLGQTF